MPRLRQSENSLLAKIERGFRSPVTGKIFRAEAGAASHLSLGIGDDAALFRPTRGCETILTCDWSLEGTHFLRNRHPADAVGWKCLARAVSDIAAMGGTPRCFLLSLALPENATGAWLAEFLRGLRRAARRLECVLAGGDTTKRNEILINITVIGELPKGRALRRDGARAGDWLYVSGRLGEAARGLRLLRQHRGMANRRDERLRKHLYPEPRLALGQWLVAKRMASAAIDLSDGLSSDLQRLCAASSVGARVDAGKLPVVNEVSAPRGTQHLSKNAQALKAAPADEALARALHGGEDYELLFTVPRSKASQVPPTLAGIPLHPIGLITANRKILLVGDGRKPASIKPGGWDPFRESK